MRHHLSSLVRLSFALSATPLAAAPLARTVLYVTQTPIPDESLAPNHVNAQNKINVTTTMPSPLADTLHAARGGALMIRYANSATPRNLTAAAGFGGSIDANQNYTGFQGAGSLAVQRPFMHWSGTKAIFSMVVGGPANAGDTSTFRWQLYEITNFGQGQTPVISHVQGQPANYDNMQACYDTQDRIIFVSDAPRGMQTHLYPQLDEYLSLACNTGLWRLDRAHSNELKHIIHAPSGAFTPFLDSAGRVMFVQWDHLSRDSSATYDRPPIAANGDGWTQVFNGNGTYDSEAANAAFTLGTQANYSTYNNFPEPRNFDKTAFVGTNLNANTFNQFFPWECHEDGSNHEMQNHVGRHELGGSLARPSFNDDPNIVLLTFNKPTALNFLHLTESPTSLGTFYAVNPPEFGTHSAGPIVSYQGGVNVNPDTMGVTYVTPNVGVPNPALGQTPLVTPVDQYRNPLPLSDGSLLAVHSQANQYDSNSGADAAHPRSRFAFRLRMLMASPTPGVTTLVPDTVNNPTAPANVTLSYFANGSLVTYSGAPLWELDPVEVVSRSVPNQAASSLPSVEQTVFDEEAVHYPTYQKYLKDNNLALAINRDSTHRDAADKQQPFNLKVAWSTNQTIGAPGKIYDIGWVQILQADALRAYTGDGQNLNAPVQPGRRTLPVPLHDTLGEMPVVAGAPAGSVKIGNDGSWAAVLPAGKALSWHMLNGAGTTSQVKERVWVNFAPGEVRTCAVCHGVNTKDQAGNLGVPQNKPAALRLLLQYWKGSHPSGAVGPSAATLSYLKSFATADVVIQRVGGSTGPASVSYATQNGTALAGTDFSSRSGTLTWNDGDAAPQTVSIPLLHPAGVGPSKSFTLNLSAPTYATLSAPAATVTLTETPLDAFLLATFGPAATTAPGTLPGDDPDGDGQSNEAEFLAGTSPTDAASVFMAKVAPAPDGQVHLQFTALPGKSYTIQYKTDLSDPNWIRHSDIPATPSGQAVDIAVPSVPGSTWFYRLATPQLP